ncbi:carbon-nitrogen hydrolase family protein [Helicobacter sp. 12S02232-10]|uniref:carbon-nitrogen hydrolase family protein n=1 Tax=Helicobacter sp. 12S02232-10 TaxID=1476197 RepID=UPI000BD542C3|nr:carbon-nitrogen hydrolase family protein [Helicobacter sp. 12S02232-10]PAF46733.1 carbon-nitrogen hydrolase family protein [Helicobacter sp. 12S02232-10]
MISKRLYALQIKTRQDFEVNLAQIGDLIQKCPQDSIVLTPEVVFSGFAYQRMEEASDFSKKVTEYLLKISNDKSIITTMIEKNGNYFYNNLKVFHKGEVIHKQAKHKLFLLGEEHLHFQAGNIEEITPFFIDGIQCGALNCFELRFIDLWKRICGAEIIFVPAQWGKARKDHYETLTKALAIANQAFVVASDSANDQMAKGSAIITPYGLVYKDDGREIVSLEADLNEVNKMRKYIHIGLELKNV